jgi:hypothetical protein
MAVTTMPPNGARSGAPREPSPVRTSTLSQPAAASAAPARAASSAWRSIVTTDRWQRASTAAP